MPLGGGYSGRGVVHGSNVPTPFTSLNTQGSVSTVSFQTQHSSDSRNHPMDEMSSCLIQEEMGDIKKELKMKTKQCEELMESHQGLQTQNMQLENTNRILQETIKCRDNQFQQLNVEIERKFEYMERCKLNDQKEAHKTQQDLERRHKEERLQSEEQFQKLAAHKGQIDKLCQDKDNQIAEKEAQISELQEEVKDWRDSWEEYDTEMQSKVSDFQAKLNGLTNELTLAQQDRSEALAEVDGLTNELTAAQQDRSKAFAEVVGLKNELTLVQQDRKKALAELAAKEADKENDASYGKGKNQINVKGQMVLGVSKESISNDPNQASEQLPLREAIVLDIGSSLCKVGFAGKQEPCSVFPTVVGRPKRRLTMPLGSVGRQECFVVGDDARHALDRVNYQFPMCRGVVENWADMEKIWQHIFFTKLLINPEEHPVLLTEPPMNPKKNREKIVEFVFESAKAPLVAIELQAVLSLYSAGLMTGLVLDSGDGVSHIAPVWNGFGCVHQFTRNHFGGKKLTEYMAMLLSKRGYKFASTEPTLAELEVVRELKEKLCYVCPSAADYDKELIQAFEEPDSFEKSFELLNGTVVKAGAERFKCPEALFRSEEVGEESVSLHTVVMQTIAKCEIDHRKEFWQNVVLTGGNTLFDGLPQRLEHELTQLAPATVRPKVIAKPNRLNAVFHGGSICADYQKNQKKGWLSKEEYQEQGPQVVHKHVIGYLQ